MTHATSIFVFRVLLIMAILLGFWFDWRRGLLLEQLLAAKDEQITALKETCHLVAPQQVKFISHASTSHISVN